MAINKFSTELRSTPKGMRDSQYTPSTTLPDKTKNPYLYDVAVKVSQMQNFDPRQMWQGLLSPILNQGGCGACYAFASCSALADRFALATMGQVKVVLNPFDAASCMLVEEASENGQLLTLDKMKSIYEDSAMLKDFMETQKTTGCSGDTLFNIARNLYIYGAATTDCIPLDKFPNVNDDPAKLSSCYANHGDKLMNCADGAKDKFKTMYRARHIHAIDFSQGMEKVILQAKIELFKFGSLASGFMVFPSFQQGYDGMSVYKPKAGEQSIGGHAIRVIGWGNQDGEDYWLCANSWGENWGDKGYFKLKMRDPQLELEQNFMCIYPDINTSMGSEQFYNGHDFFAESIEDRMAKYGMVPAIDPSHWVFVDQMPDIDKDPQSKEAKLSTPHLKFYELPNFQKFQAGDPSTWVSMLGQQFTPGQFSSTAASAGFAGQDGGQNLKHILIIGGILLVIITGIYFKSKKRTETF